MLIGDPLDEGSKASLTNRRATNHIALGSGEHILQNKRRTQTLRRERHAHK